MEWYGQVKHGSSESEAVLLLYDFYVSEQLEKSLEEVIRTIAGFRPWKRVICIDSKEMSQIMRRRYSNSVIQLRSAINEGSFDEIYIARDYGSIGTPLIINTYSDSTRITYGDSLGLVGNERELSPHWSWTLQSFDMYLRVFARKVIFGSPKRFAFDAAALTLPIDWSGSYLNNLQLLVPPKAFALNILKECSDRLAGLHAYSKRLLEGAHNPYLFLLSTLSASGVMSVQNEIEMYVKIIRKTTPLGATVLVKPHPRAESHILAAVVKETELDYSIKVIDDPEFSRIPIELWSLLIDACRIVAVFSTSCLNLSYFYGKDVVLPLDMEYIGRYCFPEWAEEIIKANRMNLESMDNLREWDGKSPLWKAPEG
jgi:hypothetical protein